MAYLVGHFDQCTGCAICQLVCSAREHNGYNPRLGNLDIRMSEDALVHFPVVCHQCENAFCERVCPVAAISRSKQTRALIVDQEACNGCELCVDACPIGMIWVIGKKAQKCDLCEGAPLCIPACPVGALDLVEKEKEVVTNS